MTNCKKFDKIPKYIEIRRKMMAVVPDNIGCENPDCIAKDDCQRQVIAKNKTAIKVKTFGGKPTKKCGNFIEK